MKNAILLIVSLFLLGSTSCGVEEPPTPPQEEQLPPITTTGENTFGCLINGELYIPKSQDILTPKIEARFYFSTGDTFKLFHLNTYIKTYDDPIQHLVIGVKSDSNYNIEIGKKYILGERRISEANGLYSYNQGFAFTDSVNIGKLIFSKFDIQSRIASGTFEFDVRINNELFEIREGRFDVKF